MIQDVLTDYFGSNCVSSNENDSNQKSKNISEEELDRIVTLSDDEGSIIAIENDAMRNVSESSWFNKAVLVGKEDSTVLVEAYDWAAFFPEYFYTTFGINNTISLPLNQNMKVSVGSN